MAKVLCIVQAGRQSGSIALKAHGKDTGSILKEQIQRLKRASLLDDIVVLTSTSEEDQKIFFDARPLGVKIMAGPEENTLDRYIVCVNAHNPSHIVRVVASNPPLKSSWVDNIVRKCLADELDYAGLEWHDERIILECFGRETLETCHRMATTPRYRDTVTDFMRERKDLFSTFIWKPLEDAQDHWRIPVRVFGHK